MFRLETPSERAWTRAQLAVRWLYDHALSDETIATVINCDGRTINRIRHGRVSGRNLEPRLLQLYALMHANYGAE